MPGKGIQPKRDKLKALPEEKRTCVNLTHYTDENTDKNTFKKGKVCILPHSLGLPFIML